MKLRQILNVGVRGLLSLVLAAGISCKHPSPSDSNASNGNTFPPDVPYECKFNLPRCNPKPESYKHATGWGMAIATGKEGIIKIDYIKTYATVNGKDTLIQLEDYGKDKDSLDGKTYPRYPQWNWAMPDSIPVEYDSEFAILDLRQHPDKVWHWWGCPVVSLPENTEKVWVETRYYAGDSTISWIGFDWWKMPEQAHTEGGISKYLFGNSQYHTISVCKE